MAHKNHVVRSDTTILGLRPQQEKQQINSSFGRGPEVNKEDSTRFKDLDNPKCKFDGCIYEGILLEKLFGGILRVLMGFKKMQDSSFKEFCS